MTRDQLLAELKRAVEAAFPDRADEILRELEARVLPDEYRDVDRLYRELSHDALTGLWSRRAVLFLLELERAAVGRDESRHLSIAVVDVDDLREVNGKHGHIAADRVLADLGMLLLAAVRPDDAVGRIGGDEFLVVMRRTSAADAARVANGIREGVERHLFDAVPGQPGLSLTVSVGVATTGGGHRERQRSAEELLRIAEENVRAAKSGGPNSVVG